MDKNGNDISLLKTYEKMGIKREDIITRSLDLNDKKPSILRDLDELDE